MIVRKLLIFCAWLLAVCSLLLLSGSPRPVIKTPTSAAVSGLIVSATPSEQDPAQDEEEALHINSESFSQHTCWFQIPEGVDVTCGFLNVPENRELPVTAQNTIRLAVAVFHSISPSPARDPVVYHIGGPGGHMLNAVPALYQKVIEPYLKMRDLILFDPRGTGFSQPALECKKNEEPRACLGRLLSEGHNLYMYNSSSMAADLQDLRRALGYDRWNLVGESYGTHVAQVAMREQPAGLRSVILDAVAPLALPSLPGGHSGFDLSLGRLFARCQQDKACNAAYPRLQETFNRAVRRLNDRPVTLNVDLAGESQPVLLDGDGLVNRTMTAMYEAQMIPYLPYAISAAADGKDYEFWDYTVQWEFNVDHLLSQGAHWAVLCGDGRIEPCDYWPIAIKQIPVTSNIPTLVLSGEFDPVTPPEYEHAVARWLPNSYPVDIPGFGHWANGTGNLCQASIIQAFLNHPKKRPDPTCLQGMKTIVFYIPDSQQSKR